MLVQFARDRQFQAERGFSILEQLVALSISAIAFTGIMHYFTKTSASARDHQLRMETLVEAQATVQTITGELRMMGNGVPFDQANFQIGETLTDMTVTEPLLVGSSNSNTISFRLNETGEVYLLSGTFNPAASLSLTLSSVDGLAANDQIYISNSVVAGDEGLYGTIQSVNTSTKTIVLNSGYVTSTGATFAVGSILEEVPVITYGPSSDTTGIARNNGSGDVLVGSNSTVTFQYLDFNGNLMTPPLSQADLVGMLRSIRVTVSKVSNATLSSGETYNLTVTQVVGIRNLNYFF